LIGDISGRSQQQRRGGPSRRHPGNDGNQIRQREHDNRDGRQQRYGNRGIGDGIDLRGEEGPQPPAAHDAEGNSRHDAHGRGHRCLPRHRGEQLSPDEAESLAIPISGLQALTPVAATSDG
jgi:hypothetical protein